MNSPYLRASIAPGASAWGVTAGMGYAEARAKLLAQGLTPGLAERDLDDSDKPLAKQYPETGGCSPTDDYPCSFVLRTPDGKGVVTVQTSGQPQSEGGQAGAPTVVGLYVAPASDAAASSKPLAADRNLLNTPAAWSPTDGGAGDLDQGADVGDPSDAYAVDGPALAQAMKAKGYAPHAFFNAARSEGRIDFVRPGAPQDVVRLFYEIHAGSVMPPTITRVEAGGAAYTDDRLRDYLGQLVGHPLAKDQ
ncbi:MAG: hypothetical protein P4L73_00985 [Caulobacteraceae bacterium]|nr:hypothetical protein [Caulobacteraceae bacterium]